MTEFWARMGGVTVSDAMVLLEAKLGPGRGVIETIARRKVAAALAWEKGITISERDVEEALEEYYHHHGVEGMDERRSWRISTHLREDALRSHMRELALIARLRTEIVAEADIERRYRETLGDRRLADIDLFEFSGETAARSFIAGVQCGDIEPRLGERHRLPMSLVPPEMATALASASEGQLLGPVATRAPTWHVYRFLRWDEPPLNARLKESIREELFREILTPMLAGDPLRFLC